MDHKFNESLIFFLQRYFRFLTAGRAYSSAVYPLFILVLNTIRASWTGLTWPSAVDLSFVLILNTISARSRPWDCYDYQKMRNAKFDKNRLSKTFEKILYHGNISNEKILTFYTNWLGIFVLASGSVFIVFHYLCGCILDI